MATKRRLTRVVPIRVTSRHREALRRLARQRDANVSTVVRDMIDDYLARNAVPAGEAQNSEHAERVIDRALGGDLDQVGAAA